MDNSMKINLWNNIRSKIFNITIWGEVDISLKRVFYNMMKWHRNNKEFEIRLDDNVKLIMSFCCEYFFVVQHIQELIDI